MQLGQQQLDFFMRTFLGSTFLVGIIFIKTFLVAPFYTSHCYFYIITTLQNPQLPDRDILPIVGLPTIFQQWLVLTKSPISQASI